MNVVEFVAGQCAVLGVALHVEVDVTARRVRVAVLDQTFHHLDHLRHVARGPWLDGRWQHAQLVVGPRERPLERRRPLPPRSTGAGGLVENLVVDVRHVAHEGNVVAVRQQPATQHVESDAAANVSDVRITLNCRPTQVHRCMSGGQRNKIPKGPRTGVV